MSLEKKTLIIGQGIAGTCLAMLFEDRQIPFRIIDSPVENTPSRIAGGVLNPVTPTRFTRIEDAEAVIEAAFRCYQKAESKFGVKMFHPLPVRYIFPDFEEVNNWSVREKKIPEAQYKGPSEPMAPYGYLEMAKTGWLDTRTFLDQYSTYWKEKGILQHKEVRELNASQQGKWAVDGEVFDQVIFCLGMHPLMEKFFPAPIFRPCKGQIIHFTLDAKTWMEEAIWKKGVYLFPEGQGHFRAGATYEWNYSNDHPDAQGKQDLLSKVNSLTGLVPQLKHIKAGIRPTTHDRIPVIGESWIAKGIWTLNGLGTRGVMMAPYLARHLIHALVDGIPVPKQYDPMRFHIRNKRSNATFAS